MDVKFICVKKQNLNSVPIVNGQLIALTDRGGIYYDMDSVRRNMSQKEIITTLPSTGNSDTLYVVTSGSKPGIYVWDEVTKKFILITDKNPDHYLTLIPNSDLDKSYITGVDGQTGSEKIYYNSDIYINFKSNTIHATNFDGNAKTATNANHSNNSDNATNSVNAEIAKKLGTVSIGNEYTGIYLVNGEPRRCLHSVKTDVPENAVFTDTTYKVFTGCTSTVDGTSGLVPKPTKLDTNKFLKSDGTWSSFSAVIMKGATSSTNGASGSVPAPTTADVNNFLKGNGTWGGYSAGGALQLNTLTFDIKNSGVTPGTYGPSPTESDGRTHKGNTFIVPQITVDKYGRITNIKEISCIVEGGSTPSQPEPTLMQFNVDDNGHLMVTYEDEATALGTFNLGNDGHLNVQYNYPDDDRTFSIGSDGHMKLTDPD